MRGLQKVIRLSERAAGFRKDDLHFWDEVQKVVDFEKVVDSLYVKPDVDFTSPVPMRICSPVILQRF